MEEGGSAGKLWGFYREILYLITIDWPPKLALLTPRLCVARIAPLVQIERAELKDFEAPATDIFMFGV